VIRYLLYYCAKFYRDEKDDPGPAIGIQI